MMLKSFALLALLSPVLALATPAAKTYKISCLVYSRESGEILAHPVVTVGLGQDAVVFEKDEFQYVAGVTFTQLPKGVAYDQVLTLKKDGAVVAQSLSSFTPGKSSNSTLASNAFEPILTCGMIR